MCGIAGVISPNHLNEEELIVVRIMNDLMFRRGPDSEGFFVGAHVALAMRRLSIIDIAGGKQPIYNEDESIVIVCNGEIYNHHELRSDLERRGHKFKSHSDVETIVHGYESSGIKYFENLRGMFAFALWDEAQHRLILARDRMGEKPLYIHRDGKGRLWFASEFRSIIKAVSNPRMTASALNLFLTYQYIPEADTPVEGVTLLPAGHLLELTPDNRQNEPTRYWDLTQAYECGSQPVAVVRDALDEACRLMGTADVPVAVALSGGIDSSLVAALTARHYPSQIQAFCVGYPGRPKSDERGFAEALASRLGMPFQEIEVDTQDVINKFPTLVRAMDVPIGDIAAPGYFAVSLEARQSGFPVLLSGMGGDELFWGYDWVREAVRRNIKLQEKSGLFRRLKRLLGHAMPHGPQFYEVHEELRMGDCASRKILTERALKDLPFNLWTEVARLDLAKPMDFAVSELLNRTWLRSNCLALVDRISMFNSVEVRLPLLDNNLIERVVGMRKAGLGDWKHPHKWLLIESLKELLPNDVLNRKKQGFTPPVAEWMRGIEKRYICLIKDGALIALGLVDRTQLNKTIGSVSPSFRYKLILAEIWTRLTLLGQTEAEINRQTNNAVS